MTRIAILSDIHGNLEALTTILQQIQGMNIELLLCLGDVVGYGPFPNECVQHVKTECSHIIMGNHDQACIDQNIAEFNVYAQSAILWTARTLTKKSKRFLATRPLSETITIEKTTLAMFHGSPIHPLDEYVDPSYHPSLLDDYIQSTGADVLLLGHTHVPMIYNSKKGGCLLNPGSVGQPRDRDPRASVAIVKIEEDQVDIEILRVSYEIKKTAKAMRTAGLPKLLSERLFHGW